MTSDVNRLEELFGDNFIGPKQLLPLKDKMKLGISTDMDHGIPSVHIPEDVLEMHRKDYILILGVRCCEDGTPLTIVKMRECFGVEARDSSPCFYNQDWYLNESFAKHRTLDNKWYLIRKEVYSEYRSIEPQALSERCHVNLNLPSAMLCAFTFFAHYISSGGEVLWRNDYVWCSDKDSNNDQIYVGRYNDPKGVSKDGFSIHRHLSVNDNYSYVSGLEVS